MILFLLVSVIAIATAAHKGLPAAVAAFVRDSVEPRTRLLGDADP
jgi:hypothetical protein